MKKEEEYEPTPNEITKAEIPIIEKMIRDECWYEGELRGCEVYINDPTVNHKVLKLIIICGGPIRKETITKLKESKKEVE